MLFYGVSDLGGLGDLSPCNNSNIFDSSADCSAGCLDDNGNPTSWGSYSNGSCMGPQAAGNSCGNGNVFDATADCSAVCIDNGGNRTTWGAYSGGMCKGPMTAPGSNPGSPGRTGAPSNPGAQPQGAGTPWWATLTTALSQGVTAGLKPGMPGYVSPPWYANPLALGGIAVGVLALIFLLKK